MSKRTRTLTQYLVIALLIIPMLACGGTSTPAAPAVIVEASETSQDVTPTETPIPDSAALPVGSSPENPAPSTDTISTAGWEFKVLEVHRGAEAVDMLKEASPFNEEHPDPTMEYVIVKINSKYAGTDTDAHQVDSAFFVGMDSANIPYDRVKITDVKAPDPSMSSFDDLFAGDEVEGWLVIQVKKDDPAILLVIRPRVNGLALGEETIRYISLVE
jgi:hypothetical protein